MAGRAREQLGSAPYRRLLEIETLEDRRLLTVLAVISPATNYSNNTVLTAAPGQGAGANVPPVLAVVLDKQVNEGELLDFSGTNNAPPLDLYVDPDLGDTHTATVDWGDGSPAQNTTIFAGTGAGVLGGTHIYADDGIYAVTLNVSDNNGGSDSKSFNVTVKNVAPVLVPISNQTVNEGQLLDLSNSGGAPALGLFVDQGFDNPLNPNGPVLPNIADPLHESFTYDVDWGDGVGAVTGASIADVNGGPGILSSGTFAGTHIYADDGTYTVTLTVHDDNGGVVSGQFTVTVKNVAPTVALNAVLPISELGFATLSGSYTDIGLLDSHTVTVDWDDPNNGLDSVFQVPSILGGPLVTTIFNSTTLGDTTTVLTVTAINNTTGQVSFSVQHQYLDDGVAPNNNFTPSDSSVIGVTVVDDDGDAGSNTTNVLVNNVTPSVSLNAVPPVTASGVATLTGSYTDIGLLDAHVFTVDWDDPSNPTNSVFTVSAIRNAAGSATLVVGNTFSSASGALLTINSINTTIGQVGFSVQHQYLAPVGGARTIDVTVDDDDGQRGSGSTPAPPVPTGDYNRNGFVDAADYVFWRKAFGSTGVPTYSGADGDGSGIIDDVDYTVWRTGFGHTGGPGSGTSVEGGVGSGERLAGRTALDEPVASAETVPHMLAFDTVEPTCNLSQRINPQARRLSMAEVKNRDDVLQASLGSHEADRWEEIGEIHRASDPQERPSYGDAIDLAIDALELNVWRRPSLKRSRY